MITIHDIEVRKSYSKGNYWEPVYKTELKVRLPESYSDATIKLTDEQTDKVIAQIVEFAKANLTFEHFSIEAPAIEKVAEVDLPSCAPADVLEPL